MKFYDNTRVSDYKTCPRKYYLRHKLDIVTDGTALPLVFGLSWHDAMDVVWAMCGKTENSNEKIHKAALQKFVETWKEWDMDFPVPMHLADKYGMRNPMVASEMLIHYIDQRRGFIAECEIIAIEQPFAVDIFDDDTQIKYIGRFDKTVRHPQHGILLIEHKTTSAYAKASGFRTDYIMSWSPNSQIDGYLHAAHMLFGKEVRGIWIDAALVHKTVHNKFRFIPMDRQFAQLDSWLHETRDWIRRIEHEAERDEEQEHIGGEAYLGYPKNTGSCGNYGGCPYRDICKFIVEPTNRNPTYSGYKIDHWEPFDILKIEELGLAPESKT